MGFVVDEFLNCKFCASNFTDYKDEILVFRACCIRKGDSLYLLFRRKLAPELHFVPGRANPLPPLNDQSLARPPTSQSQVSESNQVREKPAVRVKTWSDGVCAIRLKIPLLYKAPNFIAASYTGFPFEVNRMKTRSVTLPPDVPVQRFINQPALTAFRALSRPPVSNSSMEVAHGA